MCDPRHDPFVELSVAVVVAGMAARRQRERPGVDDGQNQARGRGIRAPSSSGHGPRKIMPHLRRRLRCGTPAAMNGPHVALSSSERGLGMRRILLGAVICSAAVTLVSAQQQSAAQLANNAPETFTANAVDISNMRARAVATSVDIHVDRYSTDQERDKLMAVFETKGQDALLDALQHLPVVG